MTYSTVNFQPETRGGMGGEGNTPYPTFWDGMPDVNPILDFFEVRAVFPPKLTNLYHASSLSTLE